jgi:transglutaminase-like putative cysteine protease
VGFGALLREALRTRRLVKRRGLAVALAQIQRITASDDVASRREDLLSILHTYYVSRLPLSQGRADCLPRSLALTSLLRRRGIDAEICFGVEKFPFRAHAWVEAGGLVINDTPNGIRRYTVLGRF